MTVYVNLREAVGKMLIFQMNLDYKTMANRMASLVEVDMNKLSVTKTSWGQQFRDAMNVNGGDLETAKAGHYIGHALAFFWKVIIRIK